MRAKKIVLGLTAAAALVSLAACSSGSASGTSTHLDAAASKMSSTSTAPTTSAPAPTTTTPTTTTPPKTTTPPPPPPPVTPAAVPIPGLPCTTAAVACVDLSAHKAWLIKDGAIAYGPVSMMPGKRGSTTPIGTFHVLYKQKMHYSKEFNNAPMPNSVFFYPGDAFHTGNIDAYSNGCVHLSSTASLEFFNFLSTGDEVQVVA